MQVSEFRDALSQFNPAGTVIVAVPSAGGPHELRAISVVGHIDKPGEVDPERALDVQVEPWDTPAMTRIGRQMAVKDLVDALAKFPDEMHVRIAVPMTHETISHRMLDVVMMGHTTGVGKGSGIQIVTESWDNPYQVIKTKPPQDGAA